MLEATFLLNKKLREMEMALESGKEPSEARERAGGEFEENEVLLTLSLLLLLLLLALILLLGSYHYY